MSNKGFTLPTGLKAGPLTIDATTNAITTSGNIRVTGSGQFVGTNAPSGAVATAPSTKVKLLLNMNGANNGTTFTDGSSLARTITRYGDTKTSTAQSKFGGASAYFDGTGDYIGAAIPPGQTSAVSFGTGSFTIECWVNFSSLPTSGAIRPFCQNDAPAGSTNTKYWFGLQNASGTYYLSLGRHSTSEYARVAWTPSTNTWYHVAVTRKSGVIYLFIDGVAQTVVKSGDLGTVSFTDNAFTVGAMSSPYYFHGYIDDFRVITGQAIYTASFTPPTAELTTSIPLPATAPAGTTTMQWTAESISADSVGNSITVGGGTAPTLSTSVYKYGSNSASFSTDSSGSYAYISDPNKTIGTFGAATGTDNDGDFTVEAWVYPTIASSQYGCAVVGNYDTNGKGWSLRVNRSYSNKGICFLGMGIDLEVGTVGTVPTNQWSHVAVTRLNGLVTIWLNGVSQGTKTSLTTDGTQLKYIVMGTTDGSASSSLTVPTAPSFGFNTVKFVGYMDNVRITKGKALYTSTFTPSDFT